MRIFRKYYIDEDPSGGPGDGTKTPVAPKDYKGIAPTVRKDWNDFLDYLDKKGVGGKTDLDKRDQSLGLNYLSQYRKENPKTSITPEIIPQIQYDQYLLRKGDSYPGLNAEQLKYVRGGLNPAYMARPVSDVDGWLGSATTKQYYPTARRGTNTGDSYDFGTNIEDYVNSVQNPDLANKYKVKPTAPAPASVPGAQPQAATPAGHGPPDIGILNGNIINGVPKGAPPNAPAVSGGTIPLPDYNDPKSRAAYLAQFPAKYGSFVHGRGDSIVRLNEVPEGGNISAKDAAVSAAKKQGLDAPLLYASTMEEGASGLYKDKKGQISGGADATEQYPISGYANYGLDNFHDDFKEMVKKGYLPKDFDYQKSPTQNENGTPVNSGIFRNTEDAMQAKAAYVHLYQDRIDDYVKKTGVDMSPRAKQFFTLIGFNGGEGTAHKLIQYYKQNGLLEGDKFLNSPPPKSVDPGGAFGHVLPRLQMADLLKKEKLIE